MKYFRPVFFMVLALATSNVLAFKALAATLPLPNVDILVKNIKSGQVVSSSTDADGNFNAVVAEDNALYDVYINDESLPPFKVTSKNSSISGRVVILTEGTTTKDPEVPQVKAPVVPATKPAEVAKPAPTVKKVTKSTVVKPTTTKKTTTTVKSKNP